MNWLFVLAVMLQPPGHFPQASLAPAADTLGDEYLGEWESNDLDGIREWDGGKCGAVFSTTRKYLIQRLPGSGALLINYTNETWAHYFRNAEANCLVEGQTAPTKMFVRLRTWQGDTRIQANGELWFDARYVDCKFMGCDADPQMFKGPFQARLAMINGRLVDMGDGATVVWQTRFWNTADLSSAKREGIAAVNEIVGHLRAEDPATFISAYLPRAGQGVGALGNIRELHRLTRHVVSRDPIDFRLIDQAAQPVGYGPTRILFSYAAAKLDNGGSGLETVLLVFEDGAWKLLTYQIAL